MTLAETMFYLLEMLGTIAFAISGAMVALERRLDIFGVLLLGLTTALGGGCVRDILLGDTPPQMFRNADYVLVALGTSLVVFLWAYFAKDYYFGHVERIDRVNNIFDAIGLGVFSVVGVHASMAAGNADNAFMCVFLGMLTGVGGGVLRDMMSREIPMVLRKRVYAIASILGAACYWLLTHWGMYETFAGIIGGAMVFLIRMLATHYRWSLPKVPHEENGKEPT